MLEPVAGTVGTILEPVAGALEPVADAGTVGTILEPVAGALEPALEPVAGTVGTILEPLTPVGAVLDPVTDTVGSVIDPVTGTDDPLAGTVELQTPAPMGTASDELAAASAPSAAASATAPSPVAGAAAAAGIITALTALVVAISTALLASDSSRAPPSRLASAASGADRPPLRELTPLLDPSLSATPKQLASVPGELSMSPPAPIPPASSGAQGSPAGTGPSAASSPGLLFDFEPSPRAFWARHEIAPSAWRSAAIVALLERPG